MNSNDFLKGPSGDIHEDACVSSPLTRHVSSLSAEPVAKKAYLCNKPETIPQNFIKKEMTDDSESCFTQQLGSEPSRGGVVENAPTFSLESRLSAIHDISSQNLLASQLLEIETQLAHKLMNLDYGPKVTHIYNPVDYAYKPHIEYYRKFCQKSAEIIMIGINPGPFGMSQTGVPFGEVKAVRQWMGICESVGSPSKLHDKRPVLGFDCKRREVSGSRIWSFIWQNFGTADNFFRQCFVYNYCPLSFMGQTGKNITPSEMPVAVRRKMAELCDDALIRSVNLFVNCKSLMGIGRFAETHIKEVCAKASLPHRQTYLLHPSPQNPHANKNWNGVARKTFEELGLLVPQSKTVLESGAENCVQNEDKEHVKRKLFCQNIGDT